MKEKKIQLHKKNMIILPLCLILGIIFLFFSEYSGDKKTDPGNEAWSEAEYTARLEERLAAMIEKMEGTADVKVMITLNGGNSFQYASKTNKSQSGQESSMESFLEMREDASGNLYPILTETRLPTVKGASVVCQGADNPVIQRRIISLVASTLDLNENQIFVTE